MRERRLAVLTVVALVMLLAWRGSDWMPSPLAQPAKVTLAVDLQQAQFTLTVASGAVALLAETR